MLSKEQIDRLDELAESVKGWSNCDIAWLHHSEDDPAAVVGHIDRDGNMYPLATIDCDQYMQGGDSIKVAKFYAAANPQAVRELIAMLREMATQLIECRKDAARYQWLREGCNEKHSAASRIVTNRYGFEWDDSIDIAMKRDCDDAQHAKDDQ